MHSSTPMWSRRAVITGCGAVSPLGNNVAALWSGLLAGRCGLQRIRSFDLDGVTVTQAGEVKDFHPEERLSAVEVARLERADQLSLSAAREALADAELDVAATDPARVGVILGTSLGGMLVGEAYQRHRSGHAAFDVRRLFDFPYYATANTLARRLGVRGPVVSPSIACASGTAAVGLALEHIRLGSADAFLVGGVETLCSFVVNGFNCLRATTPDVVRPFDAHRAGLLLGEGAAMLVIESLEHARARGAATDVEVIGAGLAGDATHMTAPARDGAGAARAMRRALADAGLTPHDIEFISAHGTGTVYNDAMEVAAIASVFGDAATRIPVNSIKGAIGHTLAAAGGFEAILCRQVLRAGLIPPTVGCAQPDPACPLDIVRDAPRRASIAVTLSTSSAFAGNNAAIVMVRRQSDTVGILPFGKGGSRGISVTPGKSPSIPLFQRGRPPDSPAVLITGIGMVSPLGLSPPELAARFTAGECAIRPLGDSPGVYGASVADIPLSMIPDAQRARTGRLDRLCRLFLAAAYLAADSAQLDISGADAERVGLSFGSGLGCLLTNAEYNQKLVEQGPAAASPRLFAYTVSSAAAGEISIALGIKGPNVTMHMGSAAGLGAVGYGYDLIRMGKADVVLAGGADACGAALVHGLHDMRLLKRDSGARPFHDRLPGLYPSEAAAVLVLERGDRARRRQARCWGRIDGYAAGFEPTLTRRNRVATGLREAMQRALAASGHAAAAVDFVLTSAHATAVDDTERAALAAVFGPGAPPHPSSPLLFAPKAAWGECFAAHGVLSLALAAAWLQAPPHAVAEHLALELDGGSGVRAAGDAPARLQHAQLAMVHALCYSGPTVTLLLRRES